MAEHCIIDTHTHLCDQDFDHDREEVLTQAEFFGVCAVITVSEDLADAQRNLELAEEYPLLRVAAGLYPTNLDPEAADAMISFIRKNREKLTAIGEVGLDYWAVKEESERAVQREIFGRFIDLSLELDLPLNVHSRSAGRPVISILLERQARKVQLHAFDGKAATAKSAVDAGYFFSVPPSVLRSRQKQKLVQQLPMSCLLVETDSPVLGPVPGERNVPTNTEIALTVIAELKKLDRQQVVETVFQNTCRLYEGILG